MTKPNPFLYFDELLAAYDAVRQALNTSSAHRYNDQTELVIAESALAREIARVARLISR